MHLQRTKPEYYLFITKRVTVTRPPSLPPWKSGGQKASLRLIRFIQLVVGK